MVIELLAWYNWIVLEELHLSKASSETSFFIATFTWFSYDLASCGRQDGVTIRF